MTTVDENYADAATPSPQETSGQGDDRYQGKTTLVPKDMCPGMKVGDNIELRIVGEQENDYEVAYEKGEDKAEEAQETKAAPTPPGDSEMRSMME